MKYLWQNIYKEYICYICIHTYVEYISVRFAVPAWLPCSCLAHFANLWEVTSLDICLRILFYRFQGRCWKPISSWRRRFNSCWVIALDLTMLTHFTPPPASWFQSYPTLSWFLCSRRCITQHKLTDNLKQNERCVICQQTASHQSRDSQLREFAEILSLQHPALFQHLLLACFLTKLPRFMSISIFSACRWKIT